jgi:hypothetical protein
MEKTDCLLCQGKGYTEKAVSGGSLRMLCKCRKTPRKAVQWPSVKDKDK